ncbi:response regulator, partial [Candidatus Fermentibacterales bacterium]|nr:response regulator [Candidatus Fermentibacterales bacterium]
LDVFGENREDIRLVLLDMTMPHMSGDEAFLELRRLDPEVKVILCSGYNEKEATRRFAGKGLSGFLQKPFRPADLVGELNRVLGEPEPEREAQER